ncbi:MAG: ATP-binding protein, partial [Pseudomonadota bacterium]
TIAHELNQPLAAITNYVGAARKLIDDRGSEIPDDARVAMQGASDEAARAGELVRRLRGFVERGELTFDYEDPVSVIDQARRSASDLFGLDDEQICVVVEGDIPKAMMDRLQIEQVVLNLLRNAFQAMRGDDSTDDQPLATITVSVTDETIEIAVIDQGPGIADDMLPTMFRPFHSDHVGGMGIGLTLTASIVRGHSGSVAARNHEDGAEITIRLPIHQPLTVEI